MKALKVSVLVVLVGLLLAPATASAWGLGGSLFDGDWFGINARKTFALGGDITEITGGATFYPEDSWFAFDADYHFVLKGEASRFYPLVGLELATDFDFAELGANLGGGVDFMMTDTLAAYFEAKFVVSDLDGFVATLGFKF